MCTYELNAFDAEAKHSERTKCKQRVRVCILRRRQIKHEHIFHFSLANRYRSCEILPPAVALYDVSLCVPMQMRTKEDDQSQVFGRLALKLGRAEYAIAYAPSG